MYNNKKRRRYKANKSSKDTIFSTKFLSLWAIRSGIILSYIWLLIWAIFGDSLPNLGYINAAAIPIAVATGFCAILLLFWRSYLWSGFGAVFFCLIFAMGSGFNFSASSENEIGDLRIVSASLRGLNKDMEAAAQRIAQYDGDIIAIQEVSDFPMFIKKLSAITNVKWYSARENSYVIISKFPTTLDASDSKYWNSAKVDTPNGPLIIWNIHAAKNFGRPAANRSFYVNLLDEFNRYNPDIILGDFNATPWNYGYRLINKKMTNTHQIAGFGPGATFPARGRSIGFLGAFSRIDHIFIKPEYKAANAFTGNASLGSDHHPVVADIIVSGR